MQTRSRRVDTVTVNCTPLQPPFGWAEITHPFHPRRGQRFAVLKARCVAGVDTLILRDTERGTLAVARDWTDLAAPRHAEHLAA